MRNNRKIEFHPFDRYVYIKQDWDHENDTQVLIEGEMIYFSFKNEDPDIGYENFKMFYRDLDNIRSLLSDRNNAYQNGKSLPDNPFDDFTSSATFSWEAAIDGIDVK